jgi:signal transduction histidine kinase
MAALGEVAARVAHEIRNPLVSLGGFAKRLEKRLDGGLKEYADIIAKEVERLETILNEILGFVKEARQQAAGAGPRRSDRADAVAEIKGGPRERIRRSTRSDPAE